MKHWGLLIFAVIFSLNSWSDERKLLETKTLRVGAEQVEAYLPLLKGKRVGLIANQTSVAFNVDLHLLDLLMSHNVNVTHVFAPEHGVRGDHSDGETVESSVDSKTGIPLVSIYGKNKRPPAQIIAQLDVIVYDIQDVGARFYTYINSMFYMMQAAQQQGIPFIVLDRPNPHLQKVDGPMLDPEFRSFVGLLPLPMVYGLTVGELAQMIVGEDWLNTIQPLPNNAKLKPLELTVIPVKHYSRSDSYDLPIPPSPNLPNAKAVALYPSLVLFEATTVSIGRGTQHPFQLVGHPKLFIGDFIFTPRSIPGVSKYPKWENTLLTGTYLSVEYHEESGVTNTELDLSILHQWSQLFKPKVSTLPNSNASESANKSANNSSAEIKRSRQYTFIDRPDFFDKLAGTNQFRADLQSGKSIKEIKRQWQAGLNQFLLDRQPYLIYP
ncbi:DUF1343 domain-containing protein [Psychrosphaera sp.]|nr:DUF1343 domain-containing protein [Psychrosphaera sp.]